MYVYGVLRADDCTRLPAEGVAGHGVTCLMFSDLAALVSDVPDHKVHPSEPNVTAHSKVLEEVAGHADVLPMRFGVRLPGADAVREDLLAANADAIRGELAAVSGCIELDVTVMSPQEAQLRSVLADDGRLRALAERLDVAGLEERLAFSEQMADAVEAQRRRVADQAYMALARVVIDAVAAEPRHEDVLAGLAFLVERRRLEAFERGVETLSGELGEERHVRCVGPLPPYHFVDLGLEEGAGAWN